MFLLLRKTIDYHISSRDVMLQCIIFEFVQHYQTDAFKEMVFRVFDFLTHSTSLVTFSEVTRFTGRLAYGWCL